MTKDWVQGVGHTPVCQIFLQTVVRAVITSAPAWTSSAGILLNTVDFPFFNYCTEVSTSLRRMEWSSSVSVWGQFSINGPPLVSWLYSSDQYFVHRVLYFSFFCDAFSLVVLDSSSLFFFHSSQVSRAGVPSRCCSSSDFIQSLYTVLLSRFPLPCWRTSWCCCWFPSISQLLHVQIFSFSVCLFLQWLKKKCSSGERNSYLLDNIFSKSYRTACYMFTTKKSSPAPPPPPPRHEKTTTPTTTRRPKVRYLHIVIVAVRMNFKMENGEVECDAEVAWHTDDVDTAQ